MSTLYLLPRVQTIIQADSRFLFANNYITQLSGLPQLIGRYPDECPWGHQVNTFPRWTYIQATRRLIERRWFYTAYGWRCFYFDTTYQPPLYLTQGYDVTDALPWRHWLSAFDFDQQRLVLRPGPRPVTLNPAQMTLLRLCLLGVEHATIADILATSVRQVGVRLARLKTEKLLPLLPPDHHDMSLARITEKLTLQSLLLSNEDWWTGVTRPISDPPQQSLQPLDTVGSYPVTLLLSCEGVIREPSRPLSYLLRRFAGRAWHNRLTLQALLPFHFVPVTALLAALSPTTSSLVHFVVSPTCEGWRYLRLAFSLTTVGSYHLEVLDLTHTVPAMRYADMLNYSDGCLRTGPEFGQLCLPASDLQLLHELFSGDTIGDIAQRLHSSVRTIHKRKAHVVDKIMAGIPTMAPGAPLSWQSLLHYTGLAGFLRAPVPWLTLPALQQQYATMQDY